MKLKIKIISVLLILSPILCAGSQSLLTSPEARAESIQGVTDFLKDVTGGISTRQPDYVRKQITDYTGELTVKKVILYVATKATTFFAGLALVLLVLAGLYIIINGADEKKVAAQGKNIAAILGAIFVMNAASVIVGIGYLEGGPRTDIDIERTVKTAVTSFVDPLMHLALALLATIAIGFVIYNAFMSLVSSASDSAAQHQSNVVYGILGIFITMLAQPLVRIFYDTNFGDLNSPFGINDIKPSGPNFQFGVDLIYQFVDYGLGILVFIAISLVIGAGYLMVVHFGNDKLVGTAKNIIKYVVVGFAIILSAYSLIAILATST